MPEVTRHIQYIGFKPRKSDVIPGSPRVWNGHGAVVTVTGDQKVFEAYAAHPTVFRDVTDAVAGKEFVAENLPQTTGLEPKEAVKSDVQDKLLQQQVIIDEQKRKIAKLEEKAVVTERARADAEKALAAAEAKLARLTAEKPETKGDKKAALKAVPPTADAVAKAMLELDPAKNPDDFKDDKPKKEAVERVLGQKIGDDVFDAAWKIVVGAAG